MATKTEQIRTDNTPGPYGDRLIIDIGNLPTERIMPLNHGEYFLAGILFELKDLNSKFEELLKRPNVEFIEDATG